MNIFHMGNNIPAISILRPSKNYPNWNFLFGKYNIWQPCAAAAKVKKVRKLRMLVHSFFAFR
jgi:hypothetical protein